VQSLSLVSGPCDHPVTLRNLLPDSHLRRGLPGGQQKTGGVYAELDPMSAVAPGHGINKSSPFPCEGIRRKDTQALLAGLSGTGRAGGLFVSQRGAAESLWP